MASIPASGTQHTLRHGDYEACIASVGSTLRCLTHRGRHLVAGFEADEVRPDFRGATLAPWPNRVVDGRYTFAGVDYQLSLTEPARSHALHGLAAWLDYGVADQNSDSVTLEATIEPRTGYPWRIRVMSTYRLDVEGLVQTVRAENLSADAAPFGTGPHPYLVAGDGKVDDWTLELPASDVLEVTPDRLSPIALAPVAGAFDYRTAAGLGATALDHAFTGLSPDTGGVVTARLTDAAGTGVGMSWGADCPWVQVFTSDFPGGAANPAFRSGVAIEPMTSAPDAFNADRYDHDAGLLVIEPGAAVEASWRIFAI